MLTLNESDHDPDRIEVLPDSVLLWWVAWFQLLSLCAAAYSISYQLTVRLNL